jgi:surfactin synthase thioesterase subunit
MYMQQLIEELYRRNGNTPVILFGHSMGGNFAYVFLRRMPRSWKRKYIKTMFTAATPWGGNFKYMYTYLYSDDFSGLLINFFMVDNRFVI